MDDEPVKRFSMSRTIVYRRLEGREGGRKGEGDVSDSDPVRDGLRVLPGMFEGFEVRSTVEGRRGRGSKHKSRRVYVCE